MLKLVEGFAPADHMAVATLGSAADAWSRRAPFDYKKMAFQLVERPAPSGLVTAAGRFVVQARMSESELGAIGNGAKIYKPDFFEVPTDFWLALYWTLLCAMLIYLLCYGGRALLILRKDPRSRKIANIYLVASASGILACTVRTITAWVPRLQGMEGGTLVWIFACGCGAGFALTSAQSWRIKTKWFSSVSQ